MNHPHQNNHRPAPPMSTANLQHPGKITHVDHLIQHLHNTGGQHIPLWVSKKLAGHLVAQHGPSGAIIPHPGIPIPMPDPQQQAPPQGYAQGGEIRDPLRPQQIDNGAIGRQVGNQDQAGQRPQGWNPQRQPFARPGLGNIPPIRRPDNVAWPQVGQPMAVDGPRPGNVPSFLGPPQQAPAPMQNGLGTGGASPVQNDFNVSGGIQPEDTGVKPPVNPRMMKKGGVVSDNDEDDKRKKKVKSKGKK